MKNVRLQERGKKGIEVEKAIRARDESLEYSIKKMVETNQVRENKTLALISRKWPGAVNK